MKTPTPSNNIVNFFRSKPTPCPYLSGQIEQQLFAELSGPNPLKTFDILSQGGFRRSHQIIYKPACKDCNECIPVRIPVKKFKKSKAWRRCINRNIDLNVTVIGAKVSEEQFSLFQQYIRIRHVEGEMSKMSRRDYAAMVLDSPVDTVMVEFRDRQSRLIACCLMDRLDGGLSAVYSFFNPVEERRSLGTFVILWMIEEAKRLDLKHVYLGYWVAGSPKMDYKVRFRTLECFGTEGWTEIENLQNNSVINKLSRSTPKS